MPFRIIYAKTNISGNFSPSIRHLDDIRINDVIGTINRGHDIPLEQHADCNGRVVSVFTYEDNQRVVGPEFPLCLVWVDSPQSLVNRAAFIEGSFNTMSITAAVRPPAAKAARKTKSTGKKAAGTSTKDKPKKGRAKGS